MVFMFLKRVFNYFYLWQTPTDHLIEAITVNVISLPHCEIVFPLQHNENLFVLHFHKVALETDTGAYSACLVLVGEM